MERDITHRCGHRRRHYVGGWCVADQDRAAARLARKHCPGCAGSGAAIAAAPMTLTR